MGSTEHGGRGGRGSWGDRGGGSSAQERCASAALGGALSGALSGALGGALGGGQPAWSKLTGFLGAGGGSASEASEDLSSEDEEAPPVPCRQSLRTEDCP